MNTDEPIGLLWLGDPHIDDNHCDWDALREHLDIINNYDGVYGCSLGDQQNNWVGRLGRLYGEQDTSHKTAWKLVEWLIQEMNPMILIGGNHDMWSGAGDPLKWIAESHTVFENWEARIALKFPNNVSARSLSRMTWLGIASGIHYTHRQRPQSLDHMHTCTSVVISTTGHWDRLNL